MNLTIHNTITRRKEQFEPLNPPFAGLYVCGPTVYGDPHLGHARPAITFDLLFRLLKDIGYRVRYVRNITDVGHLENDADEGEDKIEKKARLEALEPMEIAQYYTNRYRAAMERLNVQPASIEPLASGHILEQIEMIKRIIDHGFAYVNNGSVYFDVEAYNKKYNYGVLSGRSVEEQLACTRSLDGQNDKKHSCDFALWKKASPEHIMRWPSPWSEGFPGWHAECSAMSAKYLGESFDIHGGGMDLMFPHHECEIAQSVAANGKEAARYWVHNNMITINGQKMGKSLGNFITLDELFTGSHSVLERAYSPMTIRFFILQAHYRSTLDFSNDALEAAHKGYERLMAAMATLDKIVPSDKSTVDVTKLRQQCLEALCDDLNSPVAIAILFDYVKTINQLREGAEKITADDLDRLRKDMFLIVNDLLGLHDESAATTDRGLLSGLIDMILNVRLEAKNNKDWATSDRIRGELEALGITVKDRKDGFDWEI